MRYSFALVALFFLVPMSALAHVPNIVEQTSILDIDQIRDPMLSQAFYGTLDGFPHTYEIRAKEAFTLHVEVLIPDIESATENVSGIIIRETGQKGRVSEVTRMLAKDATWESFYEFWGGDDYRKGGVYEAEVEPGVYRVEVSTPENEAPYVLIVGNREEFGAIGYFETIRRLMEVKEFFGKSKFMVIVSPLVFIPLSVLVIIACACTWYRRRHLRIDE
jgi:hypothetical protein